MGQHAGCGKLAPAQPVQRVVDIRNDLAVAVGLRGQVADYVVDVAFRVA